MDISNGQFNNQNHCRQSLDTHERKVFQVKSINSNQQNNQKQDIVKRKKEGEYLNLGEEKLAKMIEKAKKVLLKPPTELRFSLHEETKRINIKIINKENKEIIKEIPPEKLLDMMAKLWEMAGLLVDERV